MTGGRGHRHRSRSMREGPTSQSSRPHGIVGLQAGIRDSFALPSQNPTVRNGTQSHVLLFVSRKLYRSEEHTSELQSLRHLVCRLLLEKKKNKIHNSNLHTHQYQITLSPDSHVRN